MSDLKPLIGKSVTTKRLPRFALAIRSHTHSGVAMCVDFPALSEELKGVLVRDNLSSTLAEVTPRGFRVVGRIRPFDRVLEAADREFTPTPWSIRWWYPCSVEEGVAERWVSADLEMVAEARKLCAERNVPDPFVVRADGKFLFNKAVHTLPRGSWDVAARLEDWLFNLKVPNAPTVVA